MWYAILTSADRLVRWQGLRIVAFPWYIAWGLMLGWVTGHSIMSLVGVLIAFSFIALAYWLAQKKLDYDVRWHMKAEMWF